MKVETSRGTVYLTKTGVKLKARGKVSQNVGEFLADFPKGDRRRIRKALFGTGRRREAASCTVTGVTH